MHPAPPPQGPHPTVTESIAGTAVGLRRSSNTKILLLGSFLLVAWLFLPLWKPILLGTVFALSISKYHERLARRVGQRRTLSAGVFTFLGVLLILAPLTGLAVVAVKQASSAVAWIGEVLKHGNWSDIARPLPDGLEALIKPALDRLPRSLRALGPETTEAGKWAALHLQGVVATVSEIAFDLAISLIVFFFVLADGPQMNQWLMKISPLGRSRMQELLDEFRLVSRSLIGSNLITGVVQSAVALIGYLIAGAPQPLFFGLVTLLTSFIPSVGTAIVWLPLSGLVALTGRPYSGLFLLLWGGLVVGVVDNIVRPLLMKSDVAIHGAILFLSLLGGIILFGVPGVVLGPVALSTFLTLMRFHARDLAARP